MFSLCWPLTLLRRILNWQDILSSHVSSITAPTLARQARACLRLPLSPPLPLFLDGFQEALDLGNSQDYYRAQSHGSDKQPTCYTPSLIPEFIQTSLLGIPRDSAEFNANFDGSSEAQIVPTECKIYSWGLPLHPPIRRIFSFNLNK
jgi:hypothetical protein